tara:strand:+ start:109 stop:309 length:201 start_codon:yes stop_codon:yes gene_type:complete
MVNIKMKELLPLVRTLNKKFGIRNYSRLKKADLLALVKKANYEPRNSNGWYLHPLKDPKRFPKLKP